MKKRPRQVTFESLSEYLAYWDSRGKTQAEFAAMFGISVGYLSDLKNGKVGCSLRLAKRFRDECHIPIESFIREKVS